MDEVISLFSEPDVWAALVTLVVMEIVLGIDNLIFISILSNKLPEHKRQKARRTGIGLALATRLGLLSMIAWLVGLTKPVFDLGIRGSADAHGERSFETLFSWRDLLLIGGGIFLLWKATKEIHNNVHRRSSTMVDASPKSLSQRAVVGQILLLDIIFSVDSILTAVGMTDHLPVMVIAVVFAVVVMSVAANPLANFIHNNPTLLMLALGFLLMIGVVLVADGFGVHVPKGYIYAAMAFAGGVEALNIWSRRKRGAPVAS